MNINNTGLEIAIIGMSGRFPGAENIDQYWNNLANGRETLTACTIEEMLAEGVPTELIYDKDYVNVSGVLPDYDKFDAEFFNYTSREALMLDPQCRVFLEECWKAFENAGYNICAYSGKIGVFAGSKFNNYFNYYLSTLDTKNINAFEFGLYTELSQLVTRVSYGLNLSGPSVFVQTACSTSLVAVHMACQNLLSGECNMAIAGGVTLQVPHKSGYLYQEGMIFSPDGHCRSFDKNAKGTILSNGIGVIILKRLEDAIRDNDRIDAVIKGSAVNNDGKNKIGFTAPSIDGQAEVIASAMEIAGVEPETIDYIEGHGSGTNLGDPIEIAGLTKAFHSKIEKVGFCKIGSVKTNIGHLDVASGIAGLIKAVLAMKHNAIPANLHFTSPNPKINFPETPFSINTQLTPWQPKEIPRRAGVSSFGIGGTNAHVILEEALTQNHHEGGNKFNIIGLSAKSHASLTLMINNLGKYLEKNAHENIDDIAYTLQIGRCPFVYRKAFVCQDIHETIDIIHNLKNNYLYSSKTSNKKIAFMFPGQGSQYAKMALGLYDEYEAFHQTVDECFRILQKNFAFDLKSKLFCSENEKSDNIKNTDVAQIALFVIEYALAKLLQSLGIHPNVMIGHSLGEYVAACLAGVFSLQDALNIVYWRGKLMQSVDLGSMVAVLMPARDITKYLTPLLSIAAINTENSCVISGPTYAIEEMKNKIDNKTHCVKLHTSHAFHSVMMEPILAVFKNELEKIKFSKPLIPYISNMTGTYVSEEDACNTQYWVKHLRQTVMFGDGIKKILRDNIGIYLEVGPGSTLASFVKHHAINNQEVIRLTSLPDCKSKQNGTSHFLKTVAELWQYGFDINFKELHKNKNRNKVALPTYAFDRKRYWPKISNKAVVENKTELKDEGDLVKNKKIIDMRNRDQNGIKDNAAEITLLWEEYLGENNINSTSNFFDLGGNSLVGLQLVDRINRKFDLNLTSSWLYENATIKDQVASIEKDIQQQKNNNIVLLNKMENTVPLFLIHPSMAGIEVYSELVKFFNGRQTVYGIDAYFMQKKFADINSIETLAEKYIENIRAICPKGPYFLGGWSMGGLIAYEMAKQFIIANEAVLGLYLLDSAVTIQCDKKLFHDIIPVLKNDFYKKDYYLSLPQAYKNKIIHAIEKDNFLMMNYKNYTNYSESVILYKAANIPSMKINEDCSKEESSTYNQFFNKLFSHKYNGWDKYLDNLKIINVEGCHYSIMEAPKINFIGQHLVEDMKEKELIYFAS